MDVGESGSAPVAVEKKQNNIILKGFLAFLILAIVGLTAGLVYVNFGRPKDNSKISVKCEFNDLSEVSNEIVRTTTKLSESEELDTLKAYAEQCEDREYKYQFLLAYIKELDKDIDEDSFGYYDLALEEMDKVNFPEVPLRIRGDYYQTYSIIYEDLIKQNEETSDAELIAEYKQKSAEYLELSIAAYREYYGCMGGTCGEN